MRLLVTGGAGFIGSNYVRRVLSSSDDEVTVYDALTYAGHRSSLRDVENDPRYHFVHGDVTDRGTLSEAMPGHDAVVHFAAESHVDRSIVGPDVFVHTNCGGTNVVMDVALQCGVGRVLHVSTDEVYGSIDEGSFTETDRLAPRSPYSASKAGSDLIALSYVSTHGLPVVVTRSSNNFGPYQHPEKVVPLFVTNLLEGRRVPLYGDGRNVRDWCYVEDNCAAIDMVLRRGEVGEIYNIGAGNEIDNLDLTGRLLALLGADESMIENVPDRLGHDRRYSVDTTKIRGLGWRPERDLDEALAGTVSWYRRHREWWVPLRPPGATTACVS
ncbi:MAG: dTDP-glucose 4,6-dehydratase [Acidimicrobiales bacterium]